MTFTPLRLRIAVTLMASGGTLALPVSSPDWQALSLGLMLPGGGFLLGSHWLLFTVSLTLFVICCATARTNRNLVPPLVVWLGSAIWAAEHAATAGTCQFLELFGYVYAFQYWPAAKVFVPVLSACLLVTTMPIFPAFGRLASLMRDTASLR